MNLIQNDLLMFCRGDMPSVQLLFEKFQVFSHASSLEENVDKNSIYFVDVKDNVQQEIIELFCIQKGLLPFQYYLWAPKESLFSSVSLCLIDYWVELLLGPQSSYRNQVDYNWFGHRSLYCLRSWYNIVKLCVEAFSRQGVKRYRRRL